MGIQLVLVESKSQSHFPIDLGAILGKFSETTNFSLILLYYFHRQHLFKSVRYTYYVI